MTIKPKKLYLVDGANLVFRAFYAIRGLSNSKGFPTNALYGFAQMLLKLIKDEAPTHIAVVFDTPEPTFRDEMYEEYKAGRKEPPDDLAQQFPYVMPLVEALGIPHVELPGYEADDLIGTIAKKYAGTGCDVVMVSGDKDFMQLVGDHISILDTMKDRRIGPKEVEERFGVGPERVIDVLGLSGDSSDNIPGLPGVGPKTAMKLIQEFGSIDELIAHADKLKPAIRAKLEDNLDLLKLSRDLVTIKIDVELGCDLADLVRRDPP
ncbi:MAG: DNA polymerase I, partial [candidate division Zixibacteria bacterium]|nr:DNA polymerase I [candidate division Zixibacteria bacterium]